MKRIERVRVHDWINRPCPYDPPSPGERMSRSRLANFLNKKLKTGIDADLYFKKWDEWYYMEMDAVAVRRQLTEDEMHPRGGRRPRGKDVN